MYCYNRPAYIYYIPCTREVEGGPLQFGEAVHITRYKGGGRGERALRGRIVSATGQGGREVERDGERGGTEGGGEGEREEGKREREKERKREREKERKRWGYLRCPSEGRPIFIYPPHTHSTNLIHMPFFPCGCEDLICWMSPPSAQVTSRQCPQPRLLPQRLPTPLHLARRRGSHWHA